jgi:class 3 adenylate cyclase/pimeloyl-ACP methyl ester carboxylesterase
MARPDSAISIPTTQYAKSGRYHIAYQVFGSGAFDLVIVPAFVSHVELWWDLPLAVRGLRRLGSFARVIIFDKRGTGMSDRVSEDQLPTPEERMDDVRAVMDAAGSARAAIIGSSEGGWMAALFAATYPERVPALVIHAGYPRSIQDEDFPEGWLPRAKAEEYVQEVEQAWMQAQPGAGGPVPASDESGEIRRWFSRTMRQAASPGAAVALLRMDQATDIRSVLPSIRVPTLVTVREGDENLPASRYMASKIPGARFKVFPGDEHGLFFGDQDPFLGEIEEFLTGTRTPPESDRVLSTLLFTDIVGSTKRAAELGDRRWTDLLHEHDDIIRQELERHRGRKVSSIGLGDGVLATFDGPARAIRCAEALRDRLRSLDLMIRAGIHTGEIEIRGDEISGMAVNIGARVASLAPPGELLVSQTVPTLVAGSGLSFEDRGRHHLKGVPDEWQVFAVVG